MAPRVAARTFAQVLEPWGVQHTLSVGLPPRQPRETRAEAIPREIRCDRVLPCSSYSTNTFRRTSGLQAAIVRRALPRLTAVGIPAPIRGVCGWTRLAPAQIALAKDQNAYASVMADTGMRCTRAGNSSPGLSAYGRALDFRDRQHLTLPTYSSPYGRFNVNSL